MHNIKKFNGQFYLHFSNFQNYFEVVLPHKGSTIGKENNYILNKRYIYSQLLIFMYRFNGVFETDYIPFNKIIIKIYNPFKWLDSSVCVSYKEGSKNCITCWIYDDETDRYGGCLTNCGSASNRCYCPKASFF